MTDVQVLDILLHDRRVGAITALEGDRSIFTFDEDYVADTARDTLSLSFKERYGGLYTDENRAYQTRLQPFFSNLLPEGAQRAFRQKIGEKRLESGLIGTIFVGIEAAIALLERQAQRVAGGIGDIIFVEGEDAAVAFECGDRADPAIVEQDVEHLHVSHRPRRGARRAPA